MNVFKKAFVQVIAALVLGVSLTAVGYFLVRKSNPAYNCIAGPDEQCASDLFYADYERWKSLQAEVTAGQSTSAMRALQEKSDQFNGMTQRLTAQIPQGYQWDVKKLRFVKAPAPPPPVGSAPPTAVPTTAATGNASKK